MRGFLALLALLAASGTAAADEVSLHLHDGTLCPLVTYGGIILIGGCSQLPLGDLACDIFVPLPPDLAQVVVDCPQ